MPYRMEMELLERLYWLFHQKTTRDQINRHLNDYQEADWEKLIAASRQGGAQPLLYSKLKSLGEQITVPAFVQKELRQATWNQPAEIWSCCTMRQRFWRHCRQRVST